MLNLKIVFDCKIMKKRQHTQKKESEISLQYLTHLKYLKIKNITKNLHIFLYFLTNKRLLSSHQILLLFRLIRIIFATGFCGFY